MATQLEDKPVSTAKKASKVDQFVGHQLKKTTQQVRVSDMFTGVIAIAAYTIAFFLLTAIVDAWVWSFNPTMRLILLATLMGGLALIAWYFVLPFFFRRINPQYAAKMIEEAKPEFKNSLLNYLSLKREKKSTHRAILNEVSRKAATDLSSISPDAAVDKSNLIATGFLLVALVAIAVAYFIFSPKNPWPTVMRILSPGSKISKPAAVLITDVDPGDASVFFGEKLEVSARVSGATEDDPVTIVYSTKDEQIVDALVPMNSDGAGNFSATLTTGPSGIQQSLTYRIEAGDGSSPTYSISVRPNPTINVEQIKITPPKYTGLNERTVEGNGEIQAVEGSQVEITARANLPIEFAYIVPMVANKSGKSFSEKRTIQMKSEKTVATGRIIAALNSNRDRPQFTHYKINFKSIDQHKNDNPNVYPIRVIADLAPELEIVEPSQTEVTIPVNQPLPIKVWAADLDYEISSIDIQVDHRGSKVLEKNLFKKSGQMQPGERIQAGLEIIPADLNLKPGDRAIFFVTASDNRISSRTEFLDPNVTRSENYTIIVTDAIQKETKQKPQDKQQSDKSDQDQEDRSDESQDQGSESSGQTDESDGETESKENGGQEGESQQDSDEEGTSDQNDNEDSDPQGGQDQQTGNEQSQSDQKSQDSQTPSDSSSADSDGTGNEQQSEEQTPAAQESKESPGGEDSKQDQEDESSESGSSAANKQSSQKGDDNAQSEKDSGSESGLQDSQDNEASDGSHDSRSGKKSDGNNQQSGRQADGAKENDSGQSDQEGVRDRDLQNGEVESLRENASLSEQFEELKEYFDENKDNSQNKDQPRENQPNQSQNNNRQDQPGQEGSNQKSGSKSQPPADQPKNPSNSQSNQSPNSEGENPGQPDQSDNSDSSDPQNQSNDNNNQSPQQNSNSGNSQSDSQQQPPGEPDINKQQQQSSGNSSQEEQQTGGDSSDQEPQSSGSSSQSDMGSSQSGSQASDSNDSGQQGDPQSQGDGQSSGSNGDSQEGGSESSQSSSSSQSSPSDSQDAQGSSSGAQQTGGQPTGSSSSDNANSSSESGGNENSANQSGVGGSDSGNKSESAQMEPPNPDKANLEYTKKLTDLILDQLEDQKYEPDPDLLERMNWSEQDLDNFLKQWQAMKKKAQSGDERSKRDYEDALRSLGFSPKTRSRKVVAEKDKKFTVNEDGAVDQVPAEYAEKFSNFLKRRNRSKRNRK